MNVYLDYNATTPLDKRVLKEMLPALTDNFGNAASKTHVFGWRAAEAVKKAREQIAQFIHAEESEVIFTSGATEAINLAIKGVAEAYSSKGSHIVISATEHKAVIDTCKHLEKLGKEISVVPVLSDGMINLEILDSTIRKDTVLVCTMYANNETGVILPISEISEIVHRKGSLLFTDATQASGKTTLDVNDCHADLLCLSAHKMYGPKGVGALYVRRKNPRVTLIAQMDGGGHERNFRSGTLNVPGIIGMGAACEIAGKEQWDDASRMSALRTYLEQGLMVSGRVSINGNMRNRLPNTTNLCFHDVKSETLIIKLPQFAMATGSACSSALPEPSHVLLAMGLASDQAYSSIRFSLGKFTTQEEIEYVVKTFNQVLKDNR